VSYDGPCCTICGEASHVVSFEMRKDVDGRLIDLGLCTRCHAVLNLTDLRAQGLGGGNRERQAMASDAFYEVDPQFIEGLPDAIDRHRMVEFLLEQMPDIHRGVMLDFGAGRGLLAASGAKVFERVHAVEMTLNVLMIVHAYMPGRERVILTDDFTTIGEGVDLIASMHVLEHIPDLKDVLGALVAKLNPGGALFFQVPMLRNDYIVSTHYTFFNEPAVRALAAEHGLDVVGVWFDTDLDFLTAILKKPPQPA
jgi:predicted TPR repeat methyltransferase